MPIILATQKLEIGRITVQAQAREKVIETPSQAIWVHVPVISATQEAWRRIMVQTSLGKHIRFCMKNKF
jgi:hypothetical protein